MRAEVPVAEPEPRVLAVALEHAHRGPRLVADAPAALVVEQPGEHVHDRVVVGHHEQAVAVDVVARVDDDAQLARLEDLLEPVGELRPARAAGEDDDVHVARSAWTSVIRSMVSRSYGAGIRTMTVSKPRSRYGRIASATTLRRAEEHRAVAHVGRAVGREQLPVPCLGGGRRVAG